VERRFSALTRSSLILCALAGSADARPTSGQAKDLFDQALAAFANADYPAAIDGFSKSFDLQADADTLLAWAKAEHKVGDCGKAIALFDKLLAFKLPARTRDSVMTEQAECQKMVDDTAAASASLDGAGSGGSMPAPATPDSTTPPTTPTTDDTPQPPATPSGPVESQVDDHDLPTGKAATPTPAPAPAAVAATSDTSGGGRAWWQDPIGDSLVVVGLATVGVGAGLLVSGASANNDKTTATTYGQFRSLASRANSDGTGGLVACIAGGALVAAGVVWYVTHSDHDTSPAVTAWFAPSSGGLAVTGGF
jgi:hypothetical protein